MPAPTFIFKNHNGIFYFRFIIPVKFQKSSGRKSREIRKSLKTRSKREALIKARKLWVEMTNKIENSEIFIEKDDWYDQLDTERKQKESKLRKGKEIFQKMEAVQALAEDAIDSNIFTSFMEEVIGEDWDNLQFYNVHLNEKSNLTLNLGKTLESGLISPNIPNNEKKLDSIINRFIDFKRRNKIRAKTVQGYEYALKTFSELIENPYVTEINRDRIQLFCDNLPKLPPNMNKDALLKNLSIWERIEKSENKISTQTVNLISKKIQEFLRWAFDQQELETDFSKILKILIVKDENEKTVTSFSQEDLNKIFGSDEYQKTGFTGYPFRYWVPLIALFSGCRSNEICQCYVEDIQQEENIYYINITTDNADIDESNLKDKTLKNKSSKRKIPIHKTIIQLGFLDYFEELKKRKESKLFPHLNKSSDGKYNRKISDFFNSQYLGVGYLAHVGVDKETKQGFKKNFHSFRHTFRNAAHQLQINEKIINEIVGHENPGTGNKIYSDEYNIKTKKKEIDKINFDFNLPKKWEKRFYGK